MTLAGLNLIQQALSIYDKDLRLVVCNRRFQEMFDLPARLTTPGAGFSDTIEYLAQRGEYGPVADVAAFTAERVAQAQAFEPHYFERPTTDGRFVSVEGAPLPQGGWVAVYTDITATKRHEKMLRARSDALSEQVLAHTEQLEASNRKLAATIKALEETKRQLEETEARTRLTTQMMPAHVAHVDLDRRYSFSNRQLNFVMPGRAADIIGRPIAQVLGAQTYGRIKRNLDAAFDGQASTFEFTDAISQRRIRAAFTPEKGSDGDISGVYILSMDVTEETQARAALQQTRRREMATRLTSGLAHDFSNLLTIIMGMQHKLAKMNLPEDADALIQGTLGAAQRGGNLLARIADISTARSAGPTPVALPQFLDGFLPLAQASLPPNVSLDIRNKVGDVTVMMDAGAVQDALLNLVLNARDAVGAQGKILLAVQNAQDIWLEFIVSDTGAGFSPEALDRALDPFFTTKGGEGSGLGLAMVYDMAKLAGGEVLLANTYKGARVTLRLPLRRTDPVPQGGLVLLVEDNPDLRDIWRDGLRTHKFQVIEASTAAEARALLANLPDIDAVLSDVMLEGAETGVDVAGYAAEAGKPVVLMTSLPMTDQMFISAQNCAPLLRKPFTMDDFTAALANARKEIAS